MTTLNTTLKSRAARWPVAVAARQLAAGTSPLSPDAGQTTNTLTDQYNANNTITAYCHALLNIQLNWNTSTQGPQPQWFTDLSTGLTTAQQHAALWLTGVPNPPGGGAPILPIGPTIFATIPQAIVNYGNTFTAATNDVLNIVNSLAPGQSLSSDQHTEINKLIAALIATLQVQQAQIADVQGQLDTFAADVQADHTNLLTGQNAAEAAVKIDNDKITTIKAQIALVQTKIQADSKAAMASEIGLGVAIFMVVVGVALAVATEGAAAPLVLAGIGVLGVGGAIAGTVIFSKDVNDDLNQIYQLQSELSDDQRQVTALNGIISSVTSLVTANEAATKALSDVQNMVAVLLKKLQSVLADLQQAAAPDVPAILEGLDIQTAQLAWTQLVAFATNIQTNAITVQAPITQPTQAAARARLAA